MKLDAVGTLLGPQEPILGQLVAEYGGGTKDIPGVVRDEFVPRAPVDESAVELLEAGGDIVPFVELVGVM